MGPPQQGNRGLGIGGTGEVGEKGAPRRRLPRYGRVADSDTGAVARTAVHRFHDDHNRIPSRTARGHGRGPRGGW